MLTFTLLCLFKLNYINHFDGTCTNIFTLNEAFIQYNILAINYP